MILTKQWVWREISSSKLLMLTDQGSMNLDPQTLQIISTLESSSINILFLHWGHSNVFFLAAAGVNVGAFHINVHKVLPNSL
jgi:hypothetical protein